MAKKPTKRKPGRPGNITPELENEFILKVVDGSTYKQACREMNVSYPSVARLRHSKPQFREALARAYRDGAIFNHDRQQEFMRTCKSQDVQRARELLHDARWRLSKVEAAFSERLEVRAMAQPEDDKPVDLHDTARRLAYILYHNDAQRLQEDIARARAPMNASAEPRRLAIKPDGRTTEIDVTPAATADRLEAERKERLSKMAQAPEFVPSREERGL